MRALLLASLLVFGACGKPDEAPADLLPRDRFERVVAGSLLVEARLGHERVVDNGPDARSRQYYQELFTANGVTEEQFRRTYDHYVERPEELKAVYEAALVILQQQADSLAR